ncbi:MAG: phosphoribosylformylglycinamidine synthase I, partial [Halapricum sp.]
GSKHSIAGVTGDRGDHVAVLMPHPERATLEDLGNTDGAGVLDGFQA